MSTATALKLVSAALISASLAACTPTYVATKTAVKATTGVTKAAVKAVF